MARRIERAQDRWPIPYMMATSICTILVFCMSCRAIGQDAVVLNDRSLQALEKANRYGASIFHMQGPDADFQRQMRAAIPRDYAGMDQGIRTGLANIERDLPYLSGYFEKKDPQQLASFVQIYRSKIMAPNDPIERQVRLAEVMSFIALSSYRQHQNRNSANRGFQQQQMDTLKDKQLQGAARTFSPTCFPGSKDATCHP